MARRPAGQVIERRGKHGTAFVLRFYAYGRREHLTVGNSLDGYTRARAEIELANIMADVRRGIWRPPAPEPAAVVVPDPTFHEFASEWWAAKKPELRPNSWTSYQNELSNHLLPFFARHRLSQITIQEVDRYRRAKVREGLLSPSSINKTLTRLGQILEDAVDYGHIARNPARGKRRRLRTPKNTRAHIDRADHIAALLRAAAELDSAARADRRHIPRRAILATLVFAGLRISELCNLRWRDVDLAHGRIRVGEAKTEAGIRHIDLLPALHAELAAWKQRAPHTAAADYVFSTDTGRAPSKDNFRARVIMPAIRLASRRLEADGHTPLPEGLTPHGLRHTYASILIALGKDPRYVMAQIGHADPAFTLGLYTHEMHRDDGELVRLRSLVDSPQWAQMGARAQNEAS